MSGGGPLSDLDDMIDMIGDLGRAETLEARCGLRAKVIARLELERAKLEDARADYEEALIFFLRVTRSQDEAETSNEAGGAR